VIGVNVRVEDVSYPPSVIASDGEIDLWRESGVDDECLIAGANDV
jgi:hypothetical protein